MTSIDIYDHATQRQIDNFKPTFLYIKRHTVTGMLYFGKTIRKDVSDYKGSGKYWLNHIRKHGSNFVETVWYCLFTEPKELIESALMFSQINNISESAEWANLRHENGFDGGDPGKEATDRISKALTGRKRSSSSIEKQKKTLLETPIDFTQERCENISKSLMGKKFTVERKEQCRNRKRSVKEIEQTSKNFDRTGKIPWNKGLKTGNKTKDQIPHIE